MWKLKILFINSLGQIVLEYNAKKKNVWTTFSEAVLVR
jgi:hypothetical protein